MFRRAAIVLYKACAIGAFGTAVLFGALGIGCTVQYILDNRYLGEISQNIYGDSDDPATNAIQLAQYVATRCNHPVDPEHASFRARLEEALPLKLSPVTILREGYAFPDTERFGPCGMMSRTIAALASREGVDARMVILNQGPGIGEHKMVSLYIEGKYRLFDPTFNHYWTNERGLPASVTRVVNDPDIFAQIFEKRPDYPYRFRRYVHFRWARLGAVGRWAKSTLASIKGEKWVREVDTPEFIDRPWKGYAWASEGLALVSLFVGWRMRRFAKAWW